MGKFIQVKSLLENKPAEKKRLVKSEENLKCEVLPLKLYPQKYITVQAKTLNRRHIFPVEQTKKTARRKEWHSTHCSLSQHHKGHLTSKLKYRLFPSYLLCTLSLISFSSFTFPGAPCRIFLLFLPWLPCYFYLIIITTTTFDSSSNFFVQNVEEYWLGRE